MTKLQLLLCALALIGTTAGPSVFAKSGPEIPKPAFEIEQAISLARKELLKGKGPVDAGLAKPQDYLIVNVEYKKTNNLWRWEILFVHPIYNDHTVLYAVEMDKGVHLVSATE